MKFKMERVNPDKRHGNQTFCVLILRFQTHGLYACNFLRDTLVADLFTRHALSFSPSGYTLTWWVAYCIIEWNLSNPQNAPTPPPVHYQRHLLLLQ
jgi:hypothetical protein